MERETRTIVLIDSSTSILLYHSMLLKRLEYKVITVRNAEDALRKMESVVPDIIVTDVVLPRMSGLDCIKQIKSTARLKSIPVVVLSSSADPGMRDACMRAGSASYLCKPVDPHELYRTLQTASESVPRGNIRLVTSLKVTIGDNTVLGGSTRTENATAISEGGLYVRTRYPQPRGAVTPLLIHLGSVEIRVKAVVLYRCEPGEGQGQEPGMGLKFVEISDADREAIRKFIRGQLTHDIAPAESKQEATSTASAAKARP